MIDHRSIDERSLAMHTLVAKKLRMDPSPFLTRADANIRRWLDTCSEGVRPALIEWSQLLSGPLEDLLATLEGTDETATRLRQSSPFAGALSAAERNAIIRKFHQNESRTA